MTTFAKPDEIEGDALPPLLAVQASPGTIASAPSALAGGAQLPSPGGSLIYRAPERDEQGRRLLTATPSPCPPNEVVLTAAPMEEGETSPPPGRFGLYIAEQDWPVNGPVTTRQINMRLLFDDPDLVDAEPVAVYERDIPRANDSQSEYDSPATKELKYDSPATKEQKLASGRVYKGPLGGLFASAIYDQVMEALPGQITDTGQGPIFGPPPPGSIDHLRAWAAHRDRFDDPDKPRIPGEWEYLGQYPLKEGVAAGKLPVGSPTVLAGFDKDGRIVQWSTSARDRSGRQASFYAYAGDHYSLVKPMGRPFCTGCHPGHSGMPANVLEQHRERLK